MLRQAASLRIVGFLLPIALVTATLAAADPNKEEGGKKGGSQARPSDGGDRGQGGCCGRVRALEEENARLRAELDRCSGRDGNGNGNGHGHGNGNGNGNGRGCGGDHRGDRRGPCPPAHPCPCDDFPCTPRPGTCDGDHGGGGGHGDDGDGCVRSHGYWKNHAEWPTDGQLCGRNWRDVMSDESAGDAWSILARQWIASRLNQASDADVPGSVATAMRDGDRLLRGCSISAADRQRALEIKDVLDAYVNGRMGVEKCH